ncbi:hypothetical protein C8R45DRAFT_939767 [Mycena sanguinolenta]|nr:hypothetical protein C8R45DRAFT_939767 [Mycena sanguinolenta]
MFDLCGSHSSLAKLGARNAQTNEMEISRALMGAPAVEASPSLNAIPSWYRLCGARSPYDNRLHQMRVVSQQNQSLLVLEQADAAPAPTLALLALVIDSGSVVPVAPGPMTRHYGGRPGEGQLRRRRKGDNICRDRETRTHVGAVWEPWFHARLKMLALAWKARKNGQRVGRRREEISRLRTLPSSQNKVQHAPHAPSSLIAGYSLHLASGGDTKHTGAQGERENEGGWTSGEMERVGEMYVALRHPLNGFASPRPDDVLSRPTKSALSMAEMIAPWKSKKAPTRPERVDSRRSHTHTRHAAKRHRLASWERDRMGTRDEDGMLLRDSESRTAAVAERVVARKSWRLQTRRMLRSSGVEETTVAAARMIRPIRRSVPAPAAVARAETQDIHRGRERGDDDGDGDGRRSYASRGHDSEVVEVACYARSPIRNRTETRPECSCRVEDAPMARLICPAIVNALPIHVAISRVIYQHTFGSIVMLVQLIVVGSPVSVDHDERRISLWGRILALGAALERIVSIEARGIQKNQRHDKSSGKLWIWLPSFCVWNWDFGLRRKLNCVTQGRPPTQTRSCQITSARLVGVAWRQDCRAPVLNWITRVGWSAITPLPARRRERHDVGRRGCGYCRDSPPPALGMLGYEYVHICAMWSWPAYSRTSATSRRTAQLTIQVPLNERAHRAMALPVHCLSGGTLACALTLRTPVSLRMCTTALYRVHDALCVLPEGWLAGAGGSSDVLARGSGLPPTGCTIDTVAIFPDAEDSPSTRRGSWDRQLRVVRIRRV